MTLTNRDVAQDIGLINRNIGPGVAASIDSHLASFQMVKAVRNAPGTHFNVCNKCSWLNTWHYGRSFPMTMGLPRHSWFSNLEEAANNSCQLCASLLKYCQWSHVGRLSIHMGSVSLQFLWHFMVDQCVRIWFIYLFLSISESTL